MCRVSIAILLPLYPSVERRRGAQETSYKFMMEVSQGV